MKWFRDLRIAVKLIVGFLVIAVIAGGVGIYSITSLSTMDNDNKSLFLNYGNSQGYLGNVLGEFSKQRSLYRDMIIEKDDEKTKDYQASIEASDKIMFENLDAFEKTCLLDEEKAMFADLKAKLDIFISVRNGIAEACLNGNYDGAYTLLREPNAVQSVTDATKAVDDAVRSNIDLANEQLIKQDETVNTIMIYLIVLVSVAVLLAIGLGIFISNMISKPIKELSISANRIAVGDFSSGSSTKEAKDYSKQKDEVGQLALAFKQVIQAVNILISDSDMLSQAAVEGKLSTRADAGKHQGDYAKIVQGVNNTLDAVIAPINEAAGVLKEMAKGNLDVNVTGQYKGDHAVIKNALNDTINTIKGYIAEISDVLGEMSTGNLTVSIKSDYRGDFIALKDSINGIAASLNEVLSEINIAAAQVSAGTGQVSDGSQEISQGATEQASAIEELTASVTQIADQIKQNAAKTGRAQELAMSAQSESMNGNEQMQALQQAMLEINESSSNISRIIKVIDDIAFQTNILALNAAVEAARAGVHGKGFAVVAEEVRNLAARSANAARETTDLIEGSIKKAETGTKLADVAAKALNNILNGSIESAQFMNEIAEASNQQATGITQINSGIEQMAQVVQANSSTSEQAASAAEELSSQAEFLKDMVSRFKLKDDASKVHAKTHTKTAMKKERADSPKIVLGDGDFGKY